MLMLPVRAASYHRYKRCHNSAALASSIPSARKAVICATMTPKPSSRPKGNTSTPHKGSRARKSPTSMASKIRDTRLGVGTQSACSTDQTTTIRFRASSSTVAQPSAGRK